MLQGAIRNNSRYYLVKRVEYLFFLDIYLINKKTKIEKNVLLILGKYSIQKYMKKDSLLRFHKCY